VEAELPASSSHRIITIPHNLRRAVYVNAIWALEVIAVIRSRIAATATSHVVATTAVMWIVP